MAVHRFQAFGPGGKLQSALAAPRMCRRPGLPLAVGRFGLVSFEHYLHYASHCTTPESVEVTSFADHRCPMARAVEQVGPWWNLLILRNVFLGMHRFADLEQNLGITATTLNRRLRQLCRDDILVRSRYSARPARYEYRLTDKGLDLLPVVITLTAWGKRWLAPEGQAIVARSCATNAELIPTLVDAGSGKKLVAGSFRLEPGPAADQRLRELLARTPTIPVTI